MFFISLVMTMMFMFIESRVSGDKKSYGQYIKLGIFVGSMNMLFVGITHGNWPTLPKGMFTGNVNSTVSQVGGSGVSVSYRSPMPDAF